MPAVPSVLPQGKQLCATWLDATIAASALSSQPAALPTAPPDVPIQAALPWPSSISLDDRTPRQQEAGDLEEVERETERPTADLGDLQQRQGPMESTIEQATGEGHAGRGGGRWVGRLRRGGQLVGVSVA